MELSPNEEPVWTYFDAQHKYILDQMQEVFTSAVIVVKSDTAMIITSELLINFSYAAVHERSTEEASQKDELMNAISSQLRMCMHALESKQADSVIGKLCLTYLTGYKLTGPWQLRPEAMTFGRPY